METILDVQGLSVSLLAGKKQGPVEVVKSVSFSLHKGEICALVGESGAGKSMACLAICGLLPPEAWVSGGSVRFRSSELTSLTDGDLRRLLGRSISMIFQEPMAALNPTRTVEQHIVEPLRHHLGLSRLESRQRAIELLHAVRIPSPKSRLGQYPYELSGGMAQRVLIAAALACSPDVLIADEPTTALDVTVQAQILQLLATLSFSTGTSVLLVTHDLGVVAQYASVVNVMYGGRLVESGPVSGVFKRPHHPYTSGLLQAVPRPDVPKARRLTTLPGDPLPAGSYVRGCVFHPRCGYVVDDCRDQTPRLQEIPPLLPNSPERRCACIRWDELRLSGVE